MTIATCAGDAAGVRALLWWPTSAMGALADHVRGVLQPWCTGWGVELAAIVARNSCECSPDARGIDWQSLSGTAAGVQSMDQRRSSVLQRLLFGEEPTATARPNGMAEHITGDAWADLQTCLQLALGIGSSDHMACARSDFFDPWSGGAVLTLELKNGPCTAPWHIALDASQVGGLVDSGFDTAAPDHPMPLASVASALQGNVLRVQLLMNEVELSVGQLQSLQVDDLIVIPHPIDQPLNVAIEPATSATPRLTLCHAHLGTRNGHLAMELLATEGLARHDTPDTPTSHSVSSTLLSPSH